MSEIANLETLTTKIYREGIDKADRKSREIIHKAEEQAKEIIQSAQEEAERLRSQARLEAEAIRRSCQGEMQLKGNQLIHDLQQQVVNLLNEKIVETNLKDSFEDPAFIQPLILEVVKHWNSTDELQLELPVDLGEKANRAFRKSIADQLKNLEVTFSDHLKGGFRIIKKGESFRLAFTDEAFGELFKSYLTEKTRNFIFKKND